MIPKVIHYFWVGGNPKPESVLFCIESWKKYCPDYEIIEWNETNYDFTKNEYMRQAYETKKWAYCTDYGRLDVVYKYGGVYLDTDVELIKPLDNLLTNKAFFGFERTTEQKSYVATGLGFGAEAGNTLLEEMMADFDSDNSVKKVTFLPCPQINTMTLKKHGLVQEDKDQRIMDAMIYASDVLCPKMYCSSEIHLTDRTISIHHYDASWLEGRRKNLYKRNVTLNRLLGDKWGNWISKKLEDGEYLVKAAGRKIHSIVYRR